MQSAAALRAAVVAKGGTVTLAKCQALVSQSEKVLRYPVMGYLTREGALEDCPGRGRGARKVPMGCRARGRRPARPWASRHRRPGSRAGRRLATGRRRGRRPIVGSALATSLGMHTP